MTTTAARLTGAELQALRRELDVLDETAAALAADGADPSRVRRLEEVAAGIRYLLERAVERLQVH